MSEYKNIKKNASGYDDPTAHKAITKVDKERERFEKFLNTIFTICELSGFHLEGRLTVRDKKSGRVWK